MDGKFLHTQAAGPSMADVPFGDPSPDYRPESIGHGLLDLAAWFDVYDDRSSYHGDRAIQRDLRAWAARTMEMPADPESNTRDCPGCSTDGSNFLGLTGHLPDCIYNPMRREFTPTIIRQNFDVKCVKCGSTESTMWWKCCPKHVSEQGRDVICDQCYKIYHTEDG